MVDSSLPPVTVAISFFNAESTLLDAVRSVFAQTHSNWELILIDDGSTDASLEVARSIIDKRVRVYSDGANKKLARRLNEITTLAKYDYIARMDADDLMSRDRLEKQLKVLVGRPDVDLVATGVLSLNNLDEPVGIRCVADGHQVTPQNLLRSQSGIVHGSVMARKSWYERNRYREDLPAAQDSSLWVRAYSSQDLRVIIISEPLYFYREDLNVTKDKLLRAYRLGRNIILNDAISGFSLRDRVYVYLRTFLKGAVVKAAALSGRLDVIRDRRNQFAVDNELMRFYVNEIKEIKNVLLPRK